MLRFWILLIGMTSYLHAQIEEPPPGTYTLAKGITLDGFIYPKDPLSDFRSLEFNFLISEATRAQLEFAYSSFGFQERIRIPLTVKVYLTKKLYMVTGPEVEIELNKVLFPKEPPRLGWQAGMGYEWQKNLFTEAKMNYQLNNSKIGPYGTLGRSDTFTLGTRWKF